MRCLVAARQCRVCHHEVLVTVTPPSNLSTTRPALPQTSSTQPSGIRLRLVLKCLITLDSRRRRVIMWLVILVSKSQSSCLLTESVLYAPSINSPSLTAHHLNALHRSAAQSPSVSASVARASFVSTGYHSNLSSANTQDLTQQAVDFLEPIRPDICLQHIWTDNLQ